jgi:hypothetical protein
METIHLGMKSIKIKSANVMAISKELEALRLKPEQHYELSWDLETSPILQFKDPKHETLWRVAVGYKYT